MKLRQQNYHLQINANNVIKVYYKRDIFEYKVEYYYEEIAEGTPEFKIDTEKTENGTAKFGTKINSYNDKVITGYVLDEAQTTELPFVVTEINVNNVIKVYYKRDLFNYKVEYYYEEISEKENPEFKIDNDKTDVYENIKYKTDIKSYTDKVITGYVLDEAKTTELPFARNKCKQCN